MKNKPTVASKRILNPMELRLEDWQINESLVTKAAAVLKSDKMKLMLAVLRTESPSNYGLPELGVSAEDRAAYQSRTEGYHQCLNNLELLGELKKTRIRSEPTYEDPKET